MATLKTPKPANIPQAKSYTRDEVQTAFALLDEVKTAAAATAPLPALPHKLTAPAAHTGREVMDALDASHALTLCAKVVHRVAENACNGYHYEAHEKADERREASAIKRATAILAQVAPGVTLKTGGDPRGACFYLHLPHTEAHNTWGGKESGWAVV
jgi:hypothetical protein